jgi:CRP-like cAMP-binding protein
MPHGMKSNGQGNKEEAPMNTNATTTSRHPVHPEPKQPQKQTAKEVIAANVKALIEQLEQGHSRLTEEMVERLRPYGREETLPKDLLLFTPGDRQVDMFVVLDGEIAISLPATDGETKIIAHHRRFDFSGELNLLNSQGSLVEARTVTESRILRIGRNELRRLMRAEGDIANLITQATIWRRIGILGEATAALCSWATPAMRRRQSSSVSLSATAIRTGSSKNRWKKLLSGR